MKIHTIAIPIYIVSLFCIHIGYLAVFLGFFATIPSYIKYLNIGLQCFICFFLMIRFHPFREKYHLRDSDIMLIFGSAFILFTNLVLVELVQIPMIGKYINNGFKWFGSTTKTPTIQVSISSE